MPFPGLDIKCVAGFDLCDRTLYDDLRSAADDKIEFVLVVNRLMIDSVGAKNTRVILPFLNESISHTPSGHRSVAGRGSIASILSIANLI